MGDLDWIETAAWFAEAVDDHIVYMKAIQVENKHSFKKYFGQRQILVRTGFSDRLEILLSKDVDDETLLSDFWPN